MLAANLAAFVALKRTGARLNRDVIFWRRAMKSVWRSEHQRLDCEELDKFAAVLRSTKVAW